MTSKLHSPRRSFDPRLFVLISFTLFAASLRGQVQHLAMMRHTVWAGHNGSPQGVQTLAAAPDGLLWMASLSGLYSFDGANFTKFVPNPGDPALPINIHFLLFSQQREIFVFGSHDAPVRIRDGRTQILDRTDTGIIVVLGAPQQGPDGSIWAVLNERWLVKLGKDDVWHRVDLPGDPGQHITGMHLDGRGAVWVIRNDRLYRRGSEGPRFEPTDVYVYGQNLISTGINNDLWIASSGPAPPGKAPLHLLHLDDKGKALPAPVIEEPLVASLTAKDGSLWLLTTKSILAHLGKSDLDAAQSLSVYQVKDRVQLHTATWQYGDSALKRSFDDSLWVGGTGGLEQFADVKLVPLIAGATNGVWDECVRADGSIWFIDADGTLYLKHPQEGARPVQSDAYSLHCSRHGVVFIGSKGMALLRGDRAEQLPMLPDFQGYGNHYVFTGAATLPNGSVVATAAGGALGRSLWCYSAGSWRQLQSVQALAEITGISVTEDGKVLVGFHDGTIALLEDDHLKPQKSFGENGSILGFTETSLGIMAYGAQGLAIEKAGAFTMIQWSQPELARLVTGVVSASNGDLWINAASGIVRVPANELAMAFVNPSHPLAASNIREGDVIGPSYPSLYANRAQKDFSGRLWFSTLNGIVSVKPESVVPGSLPPLLIRNALADGRPLPADRILAPDVGEVSISYTGVDFSDPSSLRYAYRLDGYDEGWQMAGQRTDALYTHLRAGRYRFRVKLQDAFGQWTAPTELAPFTVQPHLYEKRWFVAMGISILAMLLWALLQLRIRAAAATIRERSEARADERVTIARELHDTLLQGVHGLLLTLHSATEQVPAQHQSRARLERALAGAEKLILEGRDRVKGLRLLNLSGGELVSAINTVADDLGCRQKLTISLNHDDPSLILRDEVATEVFFVAREAILNAHQHADARSIVVTVKYARKFFSLECHDDGKGFDSFRLERHGGEGRWGVRGMKERAEIIGGSFALRSDANGTTVTVLVPARKAYRRR